MHYSSKYLFISLFGKEASGTVSLSFFKRKLEIDVKHSEHDWGKVKFDWGDYQTHFYMFIPIRWKCQGLRVLLFKKRAEE